MTPTPRVSVILPTYQRRELVQRAIESALAQTFHDFELIVVDDGSTDGTEEGLAGYGDRITYVRQDHAGPSPARNTALARARGELVAFLDSDDLWLPDHLATSVAVLDRHPDAVLATTCPGRQARDVDRIEDARLVDPYPRLLGETFVGWLHCCVVRRAALDAIGGFDDRIRAGEQHDMFMRLGLRGPFALVRRRTAVRRSAPNSLHEEARASGDYVSGFALTAETVLLEIESDATRPDLLPAARGRVAFADALRALHDGDEDGARDALAEACRLFPQLSSAPNFVDARIRFTAGSRARRELLRKLAMAARLWPDTACDTALYLRAHALGVAVEAGRAGEALALAGGWPWRPTGAFLRRNGPLLRSRAREWLYGRRHRV